MASQSSPFSTSPSSVSRMFVPQSVETTSSTGSRRFVAEPIEISSRSNRTKAHAKNDSSTSKKRFVPQPIETSTRRRKRAEEETPAASSSHRKFAPQLIETARRSRKTGDLHPATLPTDKTDISPGDKVQHSRYRQMHGSCVPKLEDSRFSFANLSARQKSSSQNRRHSFQIPQLESIDSHTSESSSDSHSHCPSFSTSPSASASVSTSDSTDIQTDPSRMRESCDDKFSGYLLALAAKAAEKQLREQALLAAYPNEGAHAHVDHFVPIEHDSSLSEDGSSITLGHRVDDDGDFTMRRDSDPENSNWELQEMRRHQEQLAKERGDDNGGLALLTIGDEDPFDRALHLARQADGLSPISPQENLIGRWQRRVGLEQMRDAAIPPMLGSDIIFPICQSPKQTRIDPHQHHHPHTDDSDVSPQPQVGLWLGASRACEEPVKGLWRGACTISTNQTLAPPPVIRTGIMTPREEPEDPFSSINLRLECIKNDHLPPSPPSTKQGSSTSVSGIDSVMSVEEEIEQEFDDAFVTQIYNYLSLGYPSLAWKFDEELSKISRIPIEEIRKDDDKANAKGYIGVPEGEGTLANGKDENKCSRWRALRLYIREWARQQRRLEGLTSGNTTPGDWGVVERRGSWAI